MYYDIKKAPSKKIKIKECKNSPDGYHEIQDSRKNTIPACIFCGKII